MSEPVRIKFDKHGRIEWISAPIEWPHAEIMAWVREAARRNAPEPRLRTALEGFGL